MPRDRLDIAKIRVGLAEAINSGYIEAYQLSSTAPHTSKTSITDDRLDEHSFLITELGKAKCRETPE